MILVIIWYGPLKPRGTCAVATVITLAVAIARIADISTVVESACIIDPQPFLWHADDPLIFVLFVVDITSSFDSPSSHTQNRTPAAPAITPTTPILTYGFPVGFAAAPVLWVDVAPPPMGVLTVRSLPVGFGKLTVKDELLAERLGMAEGRPLGVLVKSVGTIDET